MFEMDEKFYEELKEKIIPYFDETGSHSFSHTQRVYNLCLHLAENEEVDLDVLKISALMHDIARKKQDECEGKICHAEEGVKIVNEILKNINLNKNYMTSQLLIVLMTVLGIGLAVTPATSGINPGLFKGATWLFRGIVFRLLK